MDLKEEILKGQILSCVRKPDLKFPLKARVSNLGNALTISSKLDSFMEGLNRMSAPDEALVNEK